MDAKIVQHYNKDKTAAHYPVTIPEAVVFDDGSNLKTKSAGYETSAHASATYQPKGSYLTSHQSLANYYTKAEINAMITATLTANY